MREDRQRCYELLCNLFGDDVEPDGIVTSPLGVAWTEVFAVLARTPLDSRRLAGYGWIPLDGLLGARHRPATPRRWAVVEEGRVLAGVRLVAGGSTRCEPRSTGAANDRRSGCATSWSCASCVVASSHSLSMPEN